MSPDLHHIRAASAMRAAQSRYDTLAEPDSGDEDVIREAIRLAEECIGRAERALDAGNTDAALELLGSAVRELCEVATEEQS